MLSGRAQDLSRNLYSPAMRYFLAVAEAGSIRAASRELNVASSAVHRQVLWLEEALGLQLFDRVEGDPWTIIGMPMLPLLAWLRATGLAPQ